MRMILYLKRWLFRRTVRAKFFSVVLGLGRGYTLNQNM